MPAGHHNRNSKDRPDQHSLPGVRTLVSYRLYFLVRDARTPLGVCNSRLRIAKCFRLCAIGSTSVMHRRGLRSITSTSLSVMGLCVGMLRNGSSLYRQIRHPGQVNGSLSPLLHQGFHLWNAPTSRYDILQDQRSPFLQHRHLQSRKVQASRSTYPKRPKHIIAQIRTSLALSSIGNRILTERFLWPFCESPASAFPGCRRKLHCFTQKRLRLLKFIR